MSYRAGYAALVGRPNVGKSTLLNRLLEHKLAITSHKPQTTRHRILGIRSRLEGQIVYVDTPGMHQRGGRAMNRYLNRTARSAIAQVDVAVFVIQALSWTAEDEVVCAALEELSLPVVIAINKVDQVIPRERLLPYIAETDRRCAGAPIVPLSARTGENCAALEEEVLQRLPEGERIFPEDQLSDRPMRFFAAELLREQIVRRYHQELPYAVSVEIEKFLESPGSVNIGAIIWVESEGQRAILIGRQGEALKAAATAAREQMAKFFERRVRLDVWVKVKKSWSSDEQSLTQLGYSE